MSSTRSASRASARLGLTLRSVLLSPREGFAGAIKAADRRSRTGTRGAEGVAPYVLSFVGGAAVLVLWLKLGALFGLRSVGGDGFRWDYLVASMAAGGLGALVGQVLWGFAGRGLLGALGGDPRPRDLRIVWGAASFPHVFALAVLLPLDLIIVGTNTFTNVRLQDNLSTGWAALSIAFATSLAMWDAYLFVRGTGVAASVNTWRALLATGVGFVCLVAGIALVIACGALVLLAVAEVA